MPSSLVAVASGTGNDRLQLADPGAAPRVNAPVRTEGVAPRDGGIVLERSFAKALRLRVGATLRLRGAPGPVELRVLGTAISPAQPRYPRRNPGLAWVTRATLERIEPDRSQWRWTQPVRLADPTAAPAFAARVAAVAPPGTAFVETWEDQRTGALGDAEATGIILTTYTIVLLIVVFAVVAILVGARAGAQQREIGLLKAIGVTPRQVTAVFAIESAVLGAIAAVIGFAAGVLLAPRLAAPSAETMLGSPTTAPSAWHLAAAACPILLVLVASARSSSRRSTHFSVQSTINAAAVTPASQSRFARAIGRSSLPVVLELGAKDLLARRRRARRLAGAIAMTCAAVVFALSMAATLDARPAGEASDVPTELPVLVYTLDAVLLLITATTLIAVALLSVRERVRDYGVLKAIGLTPAQIASSLISAHAAVASIAALLSIPAGVALYVGVYTLAGGSGEDLVIAPWWRLALVPVAAVVVVIAATSIPARLASRIPAADALRYE